VRLDPSSGCWREERLELCREKETSRRALLVGRPSGMVGRQDPARSATAVTTQQSWSPAKTTEVLQQLTLATGAELPFFVAMISPSVASSPSF
jgi:hypothetical protein